MSFPRCFVFLAACLIPLLACDRGPSRSADQPTIETENVRRAGLSARTPHPEWTEGAARHMGGDARRETCGPYELVTDVVDAEILQACPRLTEPLDALYRERYALEPLGESVEAILLFADLRSYRAFVAERGMSAGYAGFSMGSRGVVILHAEVDRETWRQTLAHEAAHLVNRRALGSRIPPWLSEGLASEIGLSAKPSGFDPLPTRAGDGTRAERLRSAYREQRAGDLQRLVGLAHAEFDRDPVSFDYEQSTMLVRFLLAQEDLKPRFHAFLARLAADEPYSPELFYESIALPETALDRRFGTWLFN